MLPKGLLKEYSNVIAILMRIVDMATVFVAGWLASVLHFQQFNLPLSYYHALFLAAGITPFLFAFCKIYVSVRGMNFVRFMFLLGQAILSLGLLLGTIAFATKTGEVYSRIWFFSWLIFAFVLLVIVRTSVLAILRWMRRHGFNERRVVILGAGTLGIQFAQTVQQALWTGYRIVSFWDDSACDKPETLQGIPVRQTPMNLSAFLSHDKTIDEIWIALPMRAEVRVREIMHALQQSTITTRLLLNIFNLVLLNHSITDIAGYPVLNIRTSPMRGINRLVKAIEDRALALIIVMLISPLLLLISLAVKCTSRGPVFFKQQRLGWDGKIINVYKFRTMYQHQEAAGKVTQAKANDARITPLGRFLRRTSLDELPQFINVLQGRMSIVGPRPHALAHNDEYKYKIDTYMQRHHVKPGITGWAQVNGWRGETDTLDKMQKRVDYDLYYINHWSLWFDLKIIFLTFLRGFVHNNAY